MWSRNRISWLMLALSALVVSGCGGQPKPQTPTADGERPDPGKQSAAPGPAKKPSPQPVIIETPVVNSADPLANDPSNSPTPDSPAAPQQVFRPADERPKHDDKKLEQLGIRRYESKRLILYTDIDPKVATTLPPIIDQAYIALTEYFGALPPDRARSEYQMTGYLVKDEAAFREAGLIPGDLPPFEHGRHRRNEFWMREQKYDYYRRHLLIHEVTHCFMTVMPDVEAPVWYMEGVAEYFGTHRLANDGKVTFCVMPTSPEEFAGAGRITIIRTECSAGRSRSIDSILNLNPVEFLKTEHYSWAWGLTLFLDTHPRYRERFRELRGHLQRNAFATQYYRSFNADARDLATEWDLYVQNLQYGYDAERAAIEFQQGTELNQDRPSHQCEILADRGWQSSGVLVKEGESYELSATGRFELASVPVPWISEPQGISFRYSGGRPLGTLIACIRTEGDSGESMLKTKVIGRGTTFRVPSTGTLYLRLNDDWNSLHDNRGQVVVEIKNGNR